jgi:hypothetical protein
MKARWMGFPGLMRDAGETRWENFAPTVDGVAGVLDAGRLHQICR